MAEIQQFFGMTQKAKPREIYLDGIVMDNILSYLPEPPNNSFRLGLFYSKMMVIDGDKFKVYDDYYTILITKITNHFITFKVNFLSDDEPFILKKKKKVDDKGEYIEFKWVESKKPSEQKMAFNTKYVLNSEVFRPEFLLKENPND